MLIFSLGSWLTQDPLAKDYPSLSPYAYCAADPVNIVDPEGMDIWTFDEKGYLLKQEDNDEYDEVRIETKGNNDETFYSTIRFDNNTISQLPGWSKVRYGNKEEVDLFVIDDDNLAKQFFEFMANMTFVEWAHTGLQKNPDKGKLFNVISTSHEEFEESTAQYVYSTYKSKGYKIRFINHSHYSSLKRSTKDQIAIDKNKGVPMKIYLISENIYYDLQ